MSDPWIGGLIVCLNVTLFVQAVLVRVRPTWLGVRLCAWIALGVGSLAAVTTLGIARPYLSLIG